MGDLKSSGNSRRSSGGISAAVLCFIACSAVLAAAVCYFYKTGAILYSGDAEAHLNIARRIIDSRTPGWGQIGTVWLPLPHLLMIPLVRNDWMWQTGLAGAITSAVSMALAATFFFAGLRRLFASNLAASVGTAVFLLNPNTLYLGSIPMTEPVWFASLFALFYFTVRFSQNRELGAAMGAGLAACAGTLTRYEAWFLLAFAAAYIWIRGADRRWPATIVFLVIAGLGPVLWLLHNWWYFDDPLYFYRGPASPGAIQRGLPYPGLGDWRVAAQYFFAAGRLLAGWPALLIAAIGSTVAFARRIWWPAVLFLLPVIFYVWSIHSSGGTPIHVPDLEPHAWYNIRYAMAFLPLVGLGCAAIAQSGKSFALAAIVVALAPFALHWNEHAITWQEAEINSRGRREWTRQAVDFLRTAAGPNETFFTSFNDLTAIYRTLRIPLRLTLTGDIDPQFTIACSRPDLLLWEDWAVVMGGDTVQGVIDKARLRGPRYELSDRITVKGQPVIEIYHRVYENPFR